MPKMPSHLRNITIVQNNVIHECARIRLKAGVSERDLARSAGVSHTSIGRWEEGKWGKEATRILAAYAALMETPDEGAIWRAAVESWQTPAPGSPMAPFARDVSKATRRRPRGDAR